MRSQADVDHRLAGAEPSGAAIGTFLLAAVVPFRIAAEAMVRADRPLHRDDRARGLLLADHPGLRHTRQRSVADAAFCRIRLRLPRHGLQPHFRRHRPERRGDLRVLQLHCSVLPVRARPAGRARGARHARDRSGHRRLQRLPDRLSQSSTLSDHVGDADHRARRGQSFERAVCDRLRHQFGGEQCLGLSRRGQRARRAD